MKYISFPLVNGHKVTLFVGESQNLALVNDPSKDRCTLLDGLNNNGGWYIAKPYETVLKELTDLIFADR